MITKKIVLVCGILFASVFCIGCQSGKSGDAMSTDSPSSASQDNGASLVTSAAVQYYENNESANSLTSQAEDTGYVLDQAGLVINGSFEASAMTSDFYKFNTGTFNKISVQVYIDGQKQTELSHSTMISLNAAVDDGYSTLMGNGYFIRAWIQPSKVWVIDILPPSSPSAQNYSIELVGIE